MGNSSNKDEPPEPDLSKEELGTQRNQTIIENIIILTRWGCIEALFKRRAAVAKEILSTERSYVTSLDVLVYKQPLVDADEAGKPIIPKEDIEKLFSNVEDLIIVNKKLHLQLDERLVDWDPAKDLLADIFLARAETLRSYTEYVNNYNTALKTLSKYSTKKSFKTFLQQQFAKRIPRYCLLLQELLKSTRRKHKDYNNVQKALQAVKQVADFVNEQKREFELLEKIYDIQEQVNKFLGEEERFKPFTTDGGMDYLIMKILDVLYNRNSSGGVVPVHPEECIKSVSVGDLCLVAPGNIQMTYGMQKRYHEEGLSRSPMVSVYNTSVDALKPNEKYIFFTRPSSFEFGALELSVTCSYDELGVLSSLTPLLPLPSSSQTITPDSASPTSQVAQSDDRTAAATNKRDGSCISM